jgi:hypothetical protein
MKQMSKPRKLVNSATLLNKNSFVCKYFGEIPISERLVWFALSDYLCLKYVIIRWDLSSIDRNKSGQIFLIFCSSCFISLKSTIKTKFLFFLRLMTDCHNSKW